MLKFRVRDRLFHLSSSQFEGKPPGRTPDSLSGVLRKYGDSETRFYEKIRMCDGYFAKDDEFYFAKSSDVFESVLNLQVNGELHCPREICPIRFLRELEFWQVSPLNLAPCCRIVEGINLIQRWKENKAEAEKNISSDGNHVPQISSLEQNGQLPQSPAGSSNLRADNGATKKEPERDQFSGLVLEEGRRMVWAFMEDPSYSTGAKIFSLVSVSIVLISILNMIIGSMSVYQVENPANPEGERHPHPKLVTLEVCCIIWFTAEFLIRFLVSGDRRAFMKVPLNMIDVLSVFPFYLELSFELSGLSTESLENFKGALMVLRILRVLRVARIFKVAKYSSGLQSFGRTFKASVKELGMIVVFLFVTIVLFSTLLYFMEKDVEETEFISIPATFWWCIITMTTVGYGDMVPKSNGGKLVASVASISGVLVLAFPIMVIVENFNKFRDDPDNPDVIPATGLTTETPQRYSFYTATRNKRRQMNGGSENENAESLMRTPSVDTSDYAWTIRRKEKWEQYQSKELGKSVPSSSRA